MRLTTVLRSLGKYSADYANLPETYVKRELEQIYWKTPDAVQYMPKVIKRKTFWFGIDRPWTHQFKMENTPGKQKTKIFVEPVREWSFFRGDRVEVLVGKDKGKQGIINYIVQERNWVIVEGLNCYYKTIGKRKDYPGQMLKVEAPLLITTEVAHLDPSDHKPTVVEWRYTEDGQKVRVSVRTGRIIPFPLKAQETIDYKTKATYNEQAKDTTTDAIKKITFEPKVKTFEMDIMDEMGIVENRIPQQTYWY